MILQLYLFNDGNCTICTKNWVKMDKILPWTELPKRFVLTWSIQSFLSYQSVSICKIIIYIVNIFSFVVIFQSNSAESILFENVRWRFIARTDRRASVWKWVFSKFPKIGMDLCDLWPNISSRRHVESSFGDARTSTNHTKPSSKRIIFNIWRGPLFGFAIFWFRDVGCFGWTNQTTQTYIMLGLAHQPIEAASSSITIAIWFRVVHWPEQIWFFPFDNRPAVCEVHATSSTSPVVAQSHWTTAPATWNDIFSARNDTQLWMLFMPRNLWLSWRQLHSYAHPYRIHAVRVPLPSQVHVLGSILSPSQKPLRVDCIFAIVIDMSNLIIFIWTKKTPEKKICWFQEQ